jgi:hypothetical protein
VLGGGDPTDAGRLAMAEGLWHGGMDSSSARTSARRPHRRGVDGEVAQLGSMSTAVSGFDTLAGDGGALAGCARKRRVVSAATGSA